MDIECFVEEWLYLDLNPLQSIDLPEAFDLSDIAMYYRMNPQPHLTET
jgi:hypothetical protein